MGEIHQSRPPHIVLKTPELVVMIFAFASYRTLTSCARVCKFWTEFALNEIWKFMDNLEPALQLLAPLEKNVNGQVRCTMIST